VLLSYHLARLLLESEGVGSNAMLHVLVSATEDIGTYASIYPATKKARKKQEVAATTSSEPAQQETLALVSATRVLRATKVCATMHLQNTRHVPASK
jgi:hypothetical protein